MYCFDVVVREESVGNGVDEKIFLVPPEFWVRTSLLLLFLIIATASLLLFVSFAAFAGGGGGGDVRADVVLSLSFLLSIFSSKNNVELIRNFSILLGFPPSLRLSSFFVHRPSFQNCSSNQCTPPPFLLTLACSPVSGLGDKFENSTC